MATDDGTTPITVDDLLKMRFVTDAQLHPTKPLVAYVVGSGVSEPHEAQIATRVWLATTDAGAPPHPLTAEGTRATRPRWSPDGKRLAFLGARDMTGATQLFLLDEGWGEARQLTNCPGGVVDCAWTPDGAELTLLVTDAPLTDEAKRSERGADWIEYEQRHHFTRLWSLDPVSGHLAPLGTDDAQVYEFAWAPDSRALIALIADEPYNWSWYGARLARLDREAGAFATLYVNGKQFTAPVWSPDCRRIAVITSVWSDQGMTGGDVLLLDSDGGNPTLLTAEHPRSYVWCSWDMSRAGQLVCAAIEDGESVIGRLLADGTFEPIWREAASLLHPGTIATSNAAGTRLVVVRADPLNPPDVWTLDLVSAATPTRRTDTNPVLRERALPRTTALHWRSFDGRQIQGLLARPEGVSGPLPMAVLVHGGPTSLWTWGFNGLRSTGWTQLLAAAGFAVFMPNPRGSMGFGTAYAEANIGDMGGGDWADLLAGVDYCVGAGLADPDRLALAGWSYGGYLTAWGVTQTTRFKAAVAGASITNWISFHGVSTIPGFDAAFYPGDPFNWDGPYGMFSPMAHVRNVATPTLFLHGERDPICPVGQAHEMWRALKELGVESRLVVYPREGHGIREREHARDVLERGVRWITERV